MTDIHDERETAERSRPEPTIAEIAENLKAKFIESASRVANDADTDALVELVIKDLNAAKREVTMKLMGMRDNWGKWEVDNTNGRKTFISEAISAASKELIATWVNDTIKEVLTTKVKDKMQQEIKAAVKRELLQTSSYEVRRRVSDAAKTLMEGFLDKVVDELRRELELPIKD